MEKFLKDFVCLIFNLNPIEFNLLGTIFGYFLSIPLTVDEQNSLGNLLELIGQQLLTFNAQNELLDDKLLRKNNMTNEDLAKRIELLENKLNKLLSHK